MELYLKKLQLEEPLEIFNLLEEAAKGDWESINSITLDEFSQYLENSYNSDLGINLKKGRVPQTTYWIYSNNIPCGIIRVRRELNDFLLKKAGHIGYYIKPSFRHKGLGTKALSLCLNLLNSQNFNKVLVTCNSNNIGSQKIIERNNGLLENVIDNTNRYWINL